MSAHSEQQPGDRPTPHGVALVTGGSRGLGAGISRRLGLAGYAVAVNYWTGTAPAREVVKDIRTAGGVAEIFSADVTDEAEVAELVDRVERNLGPINVLVANATGPQPMVPIDDLSWDDHLRQLCFFVKSPTLLVRAVVPSMRESQFGRVIQIGSDMFERALPGMSAYVAAKGAQLGLTRSWARELGPDGITVNVVAPGWIPVERHSDSSKDELARYLADVPISRMGTVNDIAETVAFLASDAAGFITGQRFTVNGGHTID